MRLDFGIPRWAAHEVMRPDCDLTPIHKTELGRLYEGDCLKILPS